MAQPKNIERVFVIGATGFIGSALVHHLLQQNLHILCLVHNTPLSIHSPNVETAQGNMTNFDWEQLEDFKPDVIFHLGRMTGKTKMERREVAGKNALANEHLIKWLQKQENPPLLVFGSGTLVYGHHRDEWVDESVKMNPISFQREYHEAEQPILQAMVQSAVPVIVVRPPWVYGKGSWFEWFFWKKMTENQFIPQYGNGKNFMSLIHIDDCAGLIYHIGKYGHPGNEYNIISHPPIRQRQFVKQLQKLTGLPVQKYPSLYLWWKFDRAAREALTFSLKSATQHKDLLTQFPFKYPELQTGLRSILNRLDQK